MAMQIADFHIYKFCILIGWPESICTNQPCSPPVPISYKICPCLLAQLNKFVHVSPQRFESVQVEGSGVVGVTVQARGTPKQELDLYAIDPKGIVRVKHVVVPASGTVEVAL